MEEKAELSIIPPLESPPPPPPRRRIVSPRVVGSVRRRSRRGLPVAQDCRHSVLGPRPTRGIKYNNTNRGLCSEAVGGRRRQWQPIYSDNDAPVDVESPLPPSLSLFFHFLFIYTIISSPAPSSSFFSLLLVSTLASPPIVPP